MGSVIKFERKKKEEPILDQLPPATKEEKMEGFKSKWMPLISRRKRNSK